MKCSRSDVLGTPEARGSRSELLGAEEGNNLQLKKRTAGAARSERFVAQEENGSKPKQ